MKKEDKSLIDVENVETTGEKCCHDWADEHHWTVHCVRSSEWSTIIFTYIYVYYHTNVFLADNIYKKKLPQMAFHVYFFIGSSL